MRITIETQGGTKLEFHDLGTNDATVDFHLKDSDGEFERSYQIDKDEIIRALKAITHK